MERGRKRGCRGKNAAIFQTSPLPSPSPNEFILAVFFGRWREGPGVRNGSMLYSPAHE
jgi:hypothetical protein